MKATTTISMQRDQPMKKLMVAATALTLLTASATFADETTATSIEIVTQDAMNTAPDGSVLVPILGMIFMLLTMTGGSLQPA